MKSKQVNKPIWVLDSETDPFAFGIVPEPFIWGLYGRDGDGGEIYKEFTGTGPAMTCTYADLAEMVEYLKQLDVIVYAHNGGKFDYHFLSPFFEPENDLLIINGRLARFEIGNCEFRDSFNLMPVALEQYNKMKFDYTKMQREHRPAHMVEIREYLKSDCVNLYNMVTGFIDTYGLHITQASAAMHYWQRTLKNKVPRSGPVFYETMKPFYFGGRVQCFEQGDFVIDAKSIDINSAYPNAMLAEHAYSLEYTENDGKPLHSINNWGSMFFSIECVAKGCFPYRGTNDSLYFPDDDERRIYDVTGWELLAALDTDTVRDIKFKSHIIFSEVRNFSEYVNHFWNLRKQFKASGDDGGSFYCKIMMNALYGKFGTDPRKYRNYTLRPRSALREVLEALGEQDAVREFREWLIVATDRGGSGKGRFYNLATAASITGYVRAKLWRAVCACERPLYCDTDSITAVGFGDSIKLSDALGDWQLENEYDRIVVAGKKLYAMHKKGHSVDDKKSWKIASKGARLNHKELIKIANGETVRFANDAPTFSASKEKPTFVEREISRTASDIRIVPRRFDPKYAEIPDDIKILYQIKEPE